MPKEDPDHFWMNAEELPGEGCIYGGTIILPDGKRVNIYLEMGKDNIVTLEANIIKVNTIETSGLIKQELIPTDVFLTEEELSEAVKIGDRTMTVKRYIFEQIIPYYYNRKRKP